MDFFRFTPTVSGDHLIASTGSTDTYGYLYHGNGNQLDYNDDRNGNQNFSINWNLIAGQLYYIQVRHYGSIYGYGTGAYGLKVTAPTTVTDDHGNTMATATTIQYNSARSGNINYAGDFDYFKFTPTISKSYVFKSTGATDTYGKLFDSYGFSIRENDDYPYPNFTITQYLTAGRTYYLAVRHYSPTGTGAYSVLVTDAILGDLSYVSQFRVPHLPNGREAFDIIMTDVDIYGSQLNNFGSINAINFNAEVFNLVDRIGVQDKQMHFARNKLNRQPSSLAAMVQYINNNPDIKWRLLPIGDSAYHMNGNGGEFNLKFVSHDGRLEAVYNSLSGALVTDFLNMGTFNYEDPTNVILHVLYDVNPFYKWGNHEDQNIDRLLVTGAVVENSQADANKTKYNENPYAQYWYNYYYNLIPQ